MKNLQPLLSFFAKAFYSPSMLLHGINSPYEGRHYIAHSTFKTCAHLFKRMKPAYILEIIV